MVTVSLPLHLSSQLEEDAHTPAYPLAAMSSSGISDSVEQFFLWQNIIFRAI